MNLAANTRKNFMQQIVQTRKQHTFKEMSGNLASIENLQKTTQIHI